MKVSGIQALAFTSKIKFITDTEFKNKTQNEKRSWSNDTYIGEPWDKSIAGNKGLTEDIHACNAGGITNIAGKKVLLFHYKPRSVCRFDSIKSELQEKLNTISSCTDKLSGLLIGGKNIESMDWNYGKSDELNKKFVDLFKDWKVNFSRFSKQREYGGYSNVFYSGDEDIWYVNYQNGNKDTFNNKFNIQEPEDLKKAYSEIQISDNDQVYIGNQEVDKLSLNHSFEEIPDGFKFNFDKDKSVNLYLANFSQDKKTLWLNSDDKDAIEAVLDNMHSIKQSKKFKEIEKIQYVGNYQLSGFKKLDYKAENGMPIFEKQL